MGYLSIIVFSPPRCKIAYFVVVFCLFFISIFRQYSIVLTNNLIAVRSRFFLYTREIKGKCNIFLEDDTGYIRDKNMFYYDRS